VRLYSRPGNDLTYRFPLIVETLARLRSRSCIIDGEAVACDDKGMPSFDRSATATTTPACSYTAST
jgi:ATP-dependent DNA ligase